jgi:TonB family protein
MAYLPIPTPPTSPNVATPALPSRFPSARVQASEVSALFIRLGQLLDDSAQSFDSILASITDAALMMTGANGIAIALLSNETVVCRACTGEIAPRLGGALNVDSGISGECFRTGAALRCDDTQTDDRVDPEVCRVLGIRSIAVVPVHGRKGTVGILEALSTRPRAFAPEHLSLLQRLAEFSQAAYDRELGTDLEARDVKLPEIPVKFVRPKYIAASVPEEALAADLFGGRVVKSGRSYWIAGGITLALILISAVIWISLSDADGEGIASEPASQSRISSQENSSKPAPPATIWKPAAGRVQVRAEGLRVKGTLRNAATVEPEPSLTASDSHSPGLEPDGIRVSQDSHASEISPPLPPEIAANAPDTAAMAALVSASATLPAADLAISRGVTEAVLIHNVTPVYPAQAHIMRLGGTVVLEETIAEDGSTRNLKILSGPPLLAKAAAEAVRQWRYRPSELNGKPVAVQKQITIVFKNP